MNPKISNFIKDRTVVFFDKRDISGRIIKGAQSLYTRKEFGEKSKWSHIGVIMNGLFYESTIKGPKGLLQFLGLRPKADNRRYGCIRTLVEDRFSKKGLKNIRKLGFQYDFVQLTDDDWRVIQDAADQMIKDKTEYGGQELVGTLMRIVRWRLAPKKKKEALLQKANRFDKSNVYCVAYVADIMESNQQKLEYIDVNHSVSTVDEAWFDCEMACKSRVVKL